MSYLVFKALHVAAVCVWMLGMLAIAVLFASIQPGQGAAAGAQGRPLHAARSWNRCITMPAMLLTWALGMLLAVQGHWFGAGWLSAKLAVVLLLSALQGVQTGVLRRYVLIPGARVPGLLKLSALAIVSGVLAIVFLVLTKPF